MLEEDFFEAVQKIDRSSRGLYFQLQSLLPLLANPSSVVFTSSIVGSGGMANVSVYAATKAAVISFGKTLAVDLAPRGVRVNVISPGPIDTPILHKLGVPPEAFKGFEETIVTRTLLKRLGKPEEIALRSKPTLPAPTSCWMASRRRLPLAPSLTFLLDLIGFAMSESVPTEST